MVPWAVITYLFSRFERCVGSVVGLNTCRVVMAGEEKKTTFCGWVLETRLKW